MDEFRAIYWLTISGLNSRKINSILSNESALDFYEGFCQSSKYTTIFKEHFKQASDFRNPDLIESQLYEVSKKGIGAICLKDEKYPINLSQSEVSPPAILYYRGNLSAINNTCVAVIGTRSNSSYGKEVAELYARELALSGVTVVSGLASGIDECSHKATLGVGLTAVVLGSGISKVAPYSVNLLEKILANKGVVVSEYPPNTNSAKYTFIERNRIISGLSSAVVVIEAPLKSGALITADYALDQGRDVYAVPRGIHDTKSLGCNELIKNSKAQLTTHPNDILNNLNLKLVPINKKQMQFSLDILEQKIYNLLLNGQLHFNNIIEQSELNPSEVTAILMKLELMGIVKKSAGNYYSQAM